MTAVNEKKVFNVVDLVKNIHRLPVGIKFINKEGEFVSMGRSIVYRELGHNDLKSIWNETYAKNHPINWIAMCVCLVVDSIDGIPVYEEYVRMGKKPNLIPDIVKQLPVSDATFILFSGHVDNFGVDLPDLSSTCPGCGRKNVFPDASIKDLQVDYCDDPIHDFTIYLQKGYRFKTEDSDILYKVIKMRMPTLGDAIKFEVHYRPNNQGDFIERIYANCITDLLDDDGNSIEPSRLKGLNAAIFNSISAKDSTIIESVVNNIPSLHTMISEVCKYCSEDIPVFVQANFLYPRR